MLIYQIVFRGVLSKHFWAMTKIARDIRFIAFSIIVNDILEYRLDNTPLKSMKLLDADGADSVATGHLLQQV